MQLHITHLTTYRFETPPSYGLQQIRLSPKDSGGQNVQDWSLSFEGASLQTEFTDHHNNKTHLIRIDEGVQEMTVKSQGTVIVDDKNGIIGKHGGFAPLWYFLRQTPLTHPGAEINKLASSFSAGREQSSSVCMVSRTILAR